MHGNMPPMARHADRHWSSVVTHFFFGGLPHGSPPFASRHFPGIPTYTNGNMVSVGDRVGDFDGDALGDWDGETLGLALGLALRLVLGDLDGMRLGLELGTFVGLVAAVGSIDGDSEGLLLGLTLGLADGHGMSSHAMRSLASAPPFLQSRTEVRSRSCVPGSHVVEHAVHADHVFQHSSEHPGSQSSVSVQQPDSRERERVPLPQLPLHADQGRCGSCKCGWWLCGSCPCGSWSCGPWLCGPWLW